MPVSRLRSWVPVFAGVAIGLLVAVVAWVARSASPSTWRLCAPDA